MGNRAPYPSLRRFNLARRARRPPLAPPQTESIPCRPDSMAAPVRRPFPQNSPSCYLAAFPVFQQHVSLAPAGPALRCATPRTTLGALAAPGGDVAGAWRGVAWRGRGGAGTKVASLTCYKSFSSGQAGGDQKKRAAGLCLHEAAWDDRGWTEIHSRRSPPPP